MVPVECVPSANQLCFLEYECLKPAIVETEVTYLQCPKGTEYDHDASVAAGEVVCVPSSGIPSWVWLAAGGILAVGLIGRSMR
jgi:hypothetical protein